MRQRSSIPATLQKASQADRHKTFGAKLKQKMHLGRAFTPRLESHIPLWEDGYSAKAFVMKMDDFLDFYALKWNNGCEKTASV